MELKRYHFAMPTPTYEILKKLAVKKGFVTVKNLLLHIVEEYLKNQGEETVI